MPTIVKIPKLGKSMQDATVVEYRVKVGDRVAKGDCLFEIETDKAAVEVESPADGFVKAVLAEIGRDLPVGQPVLILGDKNEKTPQSLLDSLKPQYLNGTEKPSHAQNEFDQTAAQSPKTTASAKIKPGDILPLTKKQKITARKMLHSKRSIPCFYLNVKADVTELLKLRDMLSETADVKIPFNAFLIKSADIALQKYPLMAGRLQNDSIVLPDNINIALAIAIGDDVVAPVVKKVRQKNINQITGQISALVEKTRNNKLELTDLDDACITISNLGPLGVESFIPIVVPGQCSILGAGAVIDTCIPDNHNVAVRKIISLTLSVDHRITNGAYATSFLDFLRKTLEDTSNFT